MAASLSSVALFRAFPRLAERLAWHVVGQWPTPVEPLPGHADVFLKREDLSHALYGGNKVRTLEGHFGAARDQAAQRIWATGAYGSNHAVATVLHAQSAGLSAGAALFPQPSTHPARDNLRATLASGAKVHVIPHVVALPFSVAAIRRASKRVAERAYVMSPGGATPVGTMGHVSAALELAEQVQAGLCPAPAQLVLAVGSTCTTAGLLVGLQLAARLGIGFGEGRAPVPQVVAVRVTPWPVTSPGRIALLAYQTAVALSKEVGEVAAFSYRQLRAGLVVAREFFGSGYGKPTESGREAMAAMRAAGGPPLDVVYTAKSGAALFDLERRGTRRPLLFWTTKSSAPLPKPTEMELARADLTLRRWLEIAPV